MATCHPGRKHFRRGLCAQCYNKKQYAQNRERIAASHKKWATNNPEKIRELNRKWYAEASVACLLVKSARSRAKKRGLPFNLVETDITVPATCPLLGIALERGRSKLGPNSPTLDRIEPEKGYVIGNVWVISHKANTIKNSATPEELMMVATGLARKVAAIAEGQAKIETVPAHEGLELSVGAS